MIARDNKRYQIDHSVVLTEEQQEFILASVVRGESIKSICLKLNIPMHHVYDYAFKDPLFDKKMDRARVMNAHLLVDELMHVTDGCETLSQVQRAKVWSDNAKWVASKMEPTKYGENLNVNVSHHLDLSSILLAAENRVLPLLQAKNALLPANSASTIAPGSTIDVEVIPEAVSIAPVATGINELSVSVPGPAESSEQEQLDQLDQLDKIEAIGAIPKEWI
jgi:hypothetical protein